MKNKQIKDKSLVFEDVTLIYPNGFRALRKINFEVKPGEFVALIGNSGSGKTSILTTIPAMYKISSGKIKLGDTYIDKNSKSSFVKKIRKQIGFVFQHNNVIENLVVFDNIKTSLLNTMNPFEKLTGFISKEKTQRILLAAAKVGLTSLIYEKTKNLSGGQQQRVALARTLASDPSLILADEPVSALDVINQEKVMETLFKINKIDGITVLINLHHIDLALKYADKVIGVKDGEVVFFDNTSKVTPKVIQKIYGKSVKDITTKSINESLKYNADLKKIIK